LFDLSRFLFGQIALVESQSLSKNRVSSIVRFESGVLGTILYSCEGLAKDIGMRIFTDRGTLALTGWDFQLTENTIDSVLCTGSEEDVFLEETRAFLNAVRDGRQELILSSFCDARHTQLAMDASYASIRSHLAMEVNDHGRFIVNS
jgi:predicted dehydrogenase